MNESGRQKGNETERDTETRKHRERERERRGPGGGRNLRAPPFRMQIQEHLEAKVACKSALCSHLIGARAAAPRANTCFLQPLKNRVAYFSLFFSSLSLSFFAPPLPILSLFSLHPLNRFVPLLLFIGSRFRETPIDQNIFSRESRDGVAHCLPTSGTIFMANIKPVRFTEGGNEREREEKKPPQRRSLSNFFPSLDSKPLSRNTATRAPPPSPLIRERVSRAGEGREGREKNLRQR